MWTYPQREESERDKERGNDRDVQWSFIIIGVLAVFSSGSRFFACGSSSGSRV